MTGLMIADFTASPHAATQAPSTHRRTGMAMGLSAGIHALLLFWMADAFTPAPLSIADAGRAGGELAVMLLPAGMPQSAEATAEPETSPLSQPTPAPEIPAEVVVAKKNTVHHPKIQRKKATPRPQPTAVKKTPTRQTTMTVGNAPRLQTGTTPDAAQQAAAPATRAGESASGQSAHGAGTVIGTVTRILHRRVNYPTRARSMGLEGKVNVKFDITPAGTVTHIRILSEDPPDVFSADLRRDMSRWRYTVSGAIPDQVVTIIFKLDGRIQFIN